MGGGHDGVAVALAEGLLGEIVLVEVAARLQVGIGAMAQEVLVKRVFILPHKERGTPSGIDRLLPIAAIHLANPQRAHGEKDAAAPLPLQRGMHLAHLLPGTAAPLGDHPFERFVIGQGKLGAIGGKGRIEAALRIVIEVHVAVIIHQVVHVPHAIHAATGGGVGRGGRGKEIDGRQQVAIQQRTVGLRITTRPHLPPPRLLGRACGRNGPRREGLETAKRLGEPGIITLPTAGNDGDHQHPFAAPHRKGGRFFARFRRHDGGPQHARGNTGTADPPRPLRFGAARGLHDVAHHKRLRGVIRVTAIGLAHPPPPPARRRYG